MKQTHLKTIALAVLFSSNCFAATNTLHDKTEKTSPTVNDETYIWDVTDSTLKKSRTGSLPISTATQSALNDKANASAFASQSAFTAAWGWTPGGGVSAWSDIQALLTGTGTYVKADGTTGDPTGTIATGTGVAAAMANALDGIGGLASRASLDALPNIVFGNGITVAEDTPSAGTYTVSIDSDTAPVSGSAKPLTSGGAYTALAGKQSTLVSGTSIKTINNTSLLGGGNIDISGGGSFTFDTFPAYEDSAHSSGIAVNGTTLAVYSSTAGKWLTVGLTDTLNAAPSTYTLTIDGTGWNGTDLISVGGSTYTADGTKTGLSGATSVTVTPDTGRTATCSGTGITGSSSPYSADMSTARTIACTFSATQYGIADDFSTNTAANYTAVSGSISISSGTLGGGTSWQQNYAVHNTPTGSNDHYVQGKIQTGGVGAGGVIGLRSNGTTGYLVCLNADATRLQLFAFNGSSLSDNPNGNDAKFITGAGGAGSYAVKLSINGSAIHAYIDLNNNGYFTDSNEDLGTWTDSTYTNGQQIVVGALRGSDNGDYRVDDFSGGL